MVDIEEDETEKTLRKQGWYLGELSEEAGTTVLQSCGKFNVFIVYKTKDHYVLSARFPVEGVEEGLIEHFNIYQTEEGRYIITGQLESQETIVDVVDSYTIERETPLSPALGKRGLEAQLSIMSVSLPPEYDQANRHLQPDIAPLPKINNINPDNPVEAKAGRISPTGSLTYNRYDSDNSYGWGRVAEPTYMSNPHWWRYRDKNCCHPKNTCHFCFYRDTYWTGYREANSHKWYNCKGTGFLRCLLLIWMWCLIWPCACVGLCIWGCFMLCFFCCCYEDDD